MTQKASDTAGISVVIPTLNRGKPLVDTINALLALKVPASEIIAVDQTLEHDSATQQALETFKKNRQISWIRLNQPSVVKAMNTGLQQASSPYVLFLDDDIKPFDDLVERHQAFSLQSNAELIAGRVIQPWDDPAGNPDSAQGVGLFNTLGHHQAEFFIGANFMVKRDAAIAIGGFDENFKGTAHDYEREFSDRAILADYQVRYCGSAAVHHLKEPSGGIRAYGHFLKTIKPHHALGAYYYILRSHRIKYKPLKIVKRLYQRVATRTHLKEPWWIPITLTGDILGIAWAVLLWASGPRLIDKQTIK